MGALNEELTAARKAKGMTQEQLAEAMNVTRPAVSHWETGRTEPDLESLKRLSRILDHDFLSLSSPMQEENGEEDITSVREDGGRNTAPQRPRKRTGLYVAVGCAAVAAILCLVFLILPGSGGSSGTDPAETSGTDPAVTVERGDTVEWFSSPCVPQEGAPYVAVTFREGSADPIRSDDFPDGLGWFYTCQIDETAGQAFPIRRPGS